MGYYFIRFFSESYNLQEDTTYDGKISTYGGLFFKVQYLIYMLEKIEFNWEKKAATSYNCSDTHYCTSMS